MLVGAFVNTRLNENGLSGFKQGTVLKAVSLTQEHLNGHLRVSLCVSHKIFIDSLILDSYI